MTGLAEDDLAERTDVIVQEVTALALAAVRQADELDRSIAALREELWGR